MASPSSFKYLLVNYLSKAVEEDRKQKIIPQLRDFLAQEDLAEDAPASLAAQAIVHFCVDDGRFNNNLLAIQGILGFLEETTSVPASRRVIEDLKRTLENQPVVIQAIRHWAESHFTRRR